MTGTKYRIRVDDTLSEEFRIVTGPKRGNVLSPLPFGIASERAMRSIHRIDYGIDNGKKLIYSGGLR